MEEEEFIARIRILGFVGVDASENPSKPKHSVIFHSRETGVVILVHGIGCRIDNTLMTFEDVLDRIIQLLGGDDA